MPNGRNSSLEPVSFRRGKPPCAPQYSRQSSNGATAGGGKDALIEARIRSLEDAADAATTANVVMKRLYGRALIKRRAAERERDNLRKQLAARDAVADSSEHLSAPPTPVRTAGNGAEDDDRRSCASFASSALFGDDRDAQLDSLVDLLELLEAKIAIVPKGAADGINGNGSAFGGAGSTRASSIRGLDSTMIRAKNTLAANRPYSTIPDLVAERNALRSQLDAVKNTSRDGHPPSFEQMAAMRASLSDARADATAWRARASALERLRNGAGIGIQVTTAKLQSDLADAKRTIGRLVSERRSLRVAGAASSSVQHQSPGPKSAVPQPQPVRDPRLAPSPDVMRRVLEWRERACSEVAVSTAAVQAERTTSTTAIPYTVPISESRKARMAAREISKEASSRRKAAAKERGRNDRPERARVTARTEKGMEHLMPERLKSDLSERAANAVNSLNIRGRGFLDRESVVLSERSEQNGNMHGATSEAESNTSTHRIVGRHLSFGSAAGAPVPSSTPSDFFGAAATMQSDGLRGLIAD